MAKPEENEEYDTQFNRKLPAKLCEDAALGAIRSGLKYVNKYTAFALRATLYFQENIPTFRDTAKLTKLCYPLICLVSARNDLRKQGYLPASLDLEIKRVTDFLVKKGYPVEAVAALEAAIKENSP